MITNLAEVFTKLMDAIVQHHEDRSAYVADYIPSLNPLKNFLDSTVDPLDRQSVADAFSHEELERQYSELVLTDNNAVQGDRIAVKQQADTVAALHREYRMMHMTPAQLRAASLNRSYAESKGVGYINIGVLKPLMDILNTTDTTQT